MWKTRDLGPGSLTSEPGLLTSLLSEVGYLPERKVLFLTNLTICLRSYSRKYYQTGWYFLLIAGTEANLMKMCNLKKKTLSEIVLIYDHKGNTHV